MRNSNLARIGLFLVGLGCLLCGPQLLAADYRFVRIDFPGGTNTVARGVNARGDIVGSYSDSDGNGRGFLLRKRTYSTVHFPGAEVSDAFEINARGDIAGTHFSADGAHAYLFSDGEFTQIDYPGAIETSGFAINNAGDVAGSYANAAGWVSGFVFKDGEFRSVRDPAGLNTGVYGVQDNGKVVAGQVVRRSDGAFHGFISRRPGQFELIDFPGLPSPCTANTVTRSINQRGDIVGVFSDCDELFHGFVLRDGEYTQVDVPDGFNTRILGINDHGVLVGDYVDQHGRTRGFKAVPLE